MGLLLLANALSALPVPLMAAKNFLSMSPGKSSCFLSFFLSHRWHAFKGRKLTNHSVIKSACEETEGLQEVLSAVKTFGPQLNVDYFMVGERTYDLYSRVVKNRKRMDKSSNECTYNSSQQVNESPASEERGAALRFITIS